MAVLYTNFVIYSCVLSFVNYAHANGPYLYFLPFEMKPLTSANAEFSVPGLQPVNEINKVQLKPPLQPHHHHHKATHVPADVPHTKIIDHQGKSHADNSTIGINELLHALGLDEAIGHNHHTDHSKHAAESQSPVEQAGKERAYEYSPPPLYGPLEAPEVKAFLPDRLDIHPLMTNLLSGLFSGAVVKDFDFGLKGALIQKILKPLLLIKDVLKPLIAKLGVPLVALILINLEVLVIMWWMWEDCPRPHPAPVPHSVPYYPPPVHYPPALYPSVPYHSAPPYHSPPQFHEPAHYSPQSYYPEQMPYHPAPEPYYPGPYYSRPEPHSTSNPYY